MVKERKHIEIVRSTITSLSSMSLESCSAIQKALSKKYTNVGVTVVNTPADLQLILDGSPDLVFLGMEFVLSSSALGTSDPDKIWIGDFLDAHDIAYTGSNSRAHELQRNKSLAKQAVLDSGINTSAFSVAKQENIFNEEDLMVPYPLFIKPLDKGGGFGIDSGSVVHDFSQLIERINYIAEEAGSDSLIEQYFTGREFSVAVLKDSLSEEHYTMSVELIAPPNEYGARLLSEEVKSSNSEKAIEVVDQKLNRRICKFGLDVFRALGARDYGRIDIRLDSEGIPQFLEANLLPSLIRGYGSFPKACVLNLRLKYEDMINQIVDLGLARKYTSDSDLNADDLINIGPFTAVDVVLDAV